jgi:hypothetical protein
LLPTCDYRTVSSGKGILGYITVRSTPGGRGGREVAVQNMAAFAGSLFTIVRSKIAELSSKL